LDQESDRAIQLALANSFLGCTKLVVAHRLRTVIQSHKILALSEGSLVEAGSPRVLLENPQGALSKLVAEHGVQEADDLRQLALLGPN
jgi:ABC-type multidrug transport system fused ATPase/permease subunit